jgi:hypothetical protein
MEDQLRGGEKGTRYEVRGTRLEVRGREERDDRWGKCSRVVGWKSWGIRGAD